MSNECGNHLIPLIPLSSPVVLQISAGLPWRARSVLCRWGAFPQQGQGRARTTVRRMLTTSSRKWVRVMMSVSAVTWAPLWCPSQSWRLWSSSAWSRPPVLATGASGWSPAHILYFARTGPFNLEDNLYPQTTISLLLFTCLHFTSNFMFSFKYEAVLVQRCTLQGICFKCLHLPLLTTSLAFSVHCRTDHAALSPSHSSTLSSAHLTPVLPSPLYPVPLFLRAFCRC